MHDARRGPTRRRLPPDGGRHLSDISARMTGAGFGEEATEHPGYGRSNPAALGRGVPRGDLRRTAITSGRCVRNEIRASWDRDATIGRQVADRNQHELGDRNIRTATREFPCGNTPLASDGSAAHRKPGNWRGPPKVVRGIAHHPCRTSDPLRAPVGRRLPE